MQASIQQRLANEIIHDFGVGRVALSVMFRTDIPVASPVLDAKPQRVRGLWPETRHQLFQESVLEHVSILCPLFMGHTQEPKQQGMVTIWTAVIMNFDTRAHAAGDTS